MAPLVTVAGCGRTLPIPPPGSDRVALRMNELKASFTRVARRERDLPGVRSLAQIPDNPAAGMSAVDQSLLAAVLYLDARERLARTSRPIRDEEVRAVLARPIDISQINPQSLQRRLEEARARLESDPGYSGLLRLYESDPFATHCEDMLTGETVPCYRWIYRFTVLVPRWIDQWGP